MTAPHPENRSSLNWIVAALLALWLALVLLLGANGAFVRPPAAPPLPILLGATVPVIMFLAAYRGSGAFRALVLAADLRLLTAIQGWRAGGLGFLALYAHGVLPGLFALPAGWGDIAIAVTAPWVMLALLRRPTGALSSGIVAGLAGNVTTAPMAQLPLLLIPAFLVPLFAMLHLAALFQARQLGHAVSFLDRHNLYAQGRTK